MRASTTEVLSTLRSVATTTSGGFVSASSANGRRGSIPSSKSSTKKKKKPTIRQIESDGTVSANSHPYEPTQFRRPAGMGVHIVSSDTGRYFLFSPARNPSAPRFWSVRIDVCTKTGDIDPEMPSLLAVAQLSHEEMVEVFQIIRSDVSQWLAEPSQEEVRAWLSEVDTPPDPLTDEDLESKEEPVG